MYTSFLSRSFQLTSAFHITHNTSCSLYRKGRRDACLLGCSTLGPGCFSVQAQRCGQVLAMLKCFLSTYFFIFIRFLDRPCHALKIWINFLLCMYVLYILYISYISLSPMSLDSRLYIPVGEVTEAPKKKVPDVQLAKGATEEGAKRWIFWLIRCCDVGWFWVMLLWLLWVIFFQSACHTRDFALIM